MRDCWSRCVARLLGVEAVPDFVNDKEESWLEDTARWLQEAHGLQLVGLLPICRAQGAASLSIEKLATPNAPYIAVGTTTSGNVHAVVVDADGGMWDPDEQQPEDLERVLTVYWIVEIE